MYGCFQSFWQTTLSNSPSLLLLLFDTLLNSGTCQRWFSCSCNYQCHLNALLWDISNVCKMNVTEVIKKAITADTSDNGDRLTLTSDQIK